MFKYTTRYFYQLSKNIYRKNNLQFLIFFVTTKCNCRCGNCFYWKSLNGSEEDLSMDEIEKISDSLGNFRTLLLSGGEPFLREDLFEICRIFIERNKISTLSIPTNCSQGERMLDFIQKFFGLYPDKTLSINPSLDGPREIHDKGRGVNGIFDKAVQTISELEELKKKYPNLEIVVNTVINKNNFSQLASFMDFVYNRFKGVNFHEFELLRGDWKDKTLSLPALSEIKAAHFRIVKNTERYLRRNALSLPERIAVVGLLLLVQRLKESHIAGRLNPFVCSAGKNIGVIDANGDVKLCELMPAVGNLKKARYNFRLLWNSNKAKQERLRIIHDKCSCTHVCFLKFTSSSYLRSIFYLLYYYLGYKIKWKNLTSV